MIGMTILLALVAVATASACGYFALQRDLLAHRERLRGKSHVVPTGASRLARVNRSMALDQAFGLHGRSRCRSCPHALAVRTCMRIGRQVDVRWTRPVQHDQQVRVRQRILLPQHVLLLREMPIDVTQA